MNAVLIESHYLPSISYFASICSTKKIILESNEHFVKQTYRNRCEIITANGVEKLIVPLTSKHGKVRMKDVRIDYSQKWLQGHWRTLQSAYGKAPFFEFYCDQLHSILFSKKEFLFDLNIVLLTICLKWLKLSPEITESMSYVNEPTEGILDLRNVIRAKNGDLPSSPVVSFPYTQVFGNMFVKNMSLIDLLFCEGPGALEVVKSSARMNN